MREILVATDLSARSDRALRRAARLAAEQGAKLLVVSVVDDAYPTRLAEQLKTEVAQEIASQLASLDLGAVEIETRVEIGDPALAIAALAEARAVDLIALGAHRPRPLADLFRGATLERIVRGVSRPALLVCAPAVAPYARVVVGVDLSPASSAALSAAQRVAPMAEICAFHAAHAPYADRFGGGQSGPGEAFRGAAAAELDAWIAEGGLPEGAPRPEITLEPVSAALARRIAEAPTDLIALGAHGRAGLNPTLLGRFVEETLRDPPCDVLVVRRDRVG